jgi:hypothetical protein
MAHTPQNLTKELSISTGYFAHPSTKMISRFGDWYLYFPANAQNSALNAKYIPYTWGTAVPLINSQSDLTMEGTMALLTEPWDGSNVVYHGGCIAHIGSGVNDITNTQEDDAWFFAHLGTLSTDPDDDGFYWDRTYLASGTSTWDYYQYHLHEPSFYQVYENGRTVQSADTSINLTDRQYAYLINTRVKVGATFYQSVMARIHTPSIGGAHNSHNDVTLPTTANKNYMMGGIMAGVGNRFHAFYIASNGSGDWNVYTRTYITTSGSFTAENNLGVYNLADPTVDPTNGQCYNYPVRASAGTVLTDRLYFPVIMNNATSGYDLEIWSFLSLDALGTGSLIRHTLLSGQATRPDCHLVTVGDKIYAAASNITGGGVSLHVFDGSTWEAGTTNILTNSATNELRVHGIAYNTEDVKFYCLVSGTTSSTGTYTGPGLYSFDLGAEFAGYPHLDYDATNNAFLVRPALSAGHLIYDVTTSSITRSAATEPQGIGSSVNILAYSILDPNFFNKSELPLEADEYIYHGITLDDNRKLLAGRIKDLSYGTGAGDLLVSIVEQDNKTMHHFAWGGVQDPTVVCPIVPSTGDDYITGVYQSKADPTKVWMCGYTKSEMIPKKDIKIHGFCRNTSDDPNLLQWNDLVTDSGGNIYLIGTNQDGYGIVSKFCLNYILRWQKSLGTNDAVTGNAIAVDSSDYLYTIGTDSETTNAIVTKLDTDGNVIWAKTYGDAGSNTGTGIAIIKKNSTDYVVISVVTGTSTTFMVLDTNGAVQEQNTVSSLVVNRVRVQKSTQDGTFLFAGTNGSTSGKFGAGVLGHETRMIQWTSTFGTASKDIVNIEGGPNYTYAVVGTSSTSASILKVTVTESGGVYTVTKTWARTIANSGFNAVTTDANNNIFVVGKNTGNGTAVMGLQEGLVVRYNNAGAVQWINVFGHDMNEDITGVVMDITGDNIIVSGWSESHSNARDAIVFRCEIGGYGTGVYHLNGNTGVPYYYTKAVTPTEASDASSITNLTAPANSTGALTTTDVSGTIVWQNSGALVRIFDGSYGANGTFMLWWGYLDLKKVQDYLNSQEYRDNQIAGRTVNYTDSIFTFWQIATVGDGTADDGNVFGYDIIEAASGKVYVVGQTSGDLTTINQGASGVYEYILVEFDPATEALYILQKDSVKDVEMYALTELANGNIAYTGRTTDPDIANIAYGGYDIILGIFDPSARIADYYVYGSGFDDKGVNLHDLGNNTLAITYSSYGALGDQVNAGTEDVGVVLFNYSTDTWGNAYQTGSTTSDIFEQNGKPSTLLDGNRIAVVFSTGGYFDETGISYGYLDIALAMLDLTTGEWFKTQIGSVTSDIASSVSVKGDRLLICGHMQETFGNAGQGIYVEVDVTRGFGGKSSSL